MRVVVLRSLKEKSLGGKDLLFLYIPVHYYVLILVVIQKQRQDAYIQKKIIREIKIWSIACSTYT